MWTPSFLTFFRGYRNGILGQNRLIFWSFVFREMKINSGLSHKDCLSEEIRIQDPRKHVR